MKFLAFVVIFGLAVSASAHSSSQEVELDEGLFIKAIGKVMMKLKALAVMQGAENEEEGRLDMFTKKMVCYGQNLTMKVHLTWHSTNHSLLSTVL